MNNIKNSITLLILSLLSTAAFAGMPAPIESVFSQVSLWLFAAAGITITIAVTLVGYKIIFGGKTFEDMKNVIVGGACIAGASAIGGAISAFIS